MNDENKKTEKSEFFFGDDVFYSTEKVSGETAPEAEIKVEETVVSITVDYEHMACVARTGIFCCIGNGAAIVKTLLDFCFPLLLFQTRKSTAILHNSFLVERSSIFQVEVS